MILCIYCYYSKLYLLFKQKTVYELRISDWSSDVCSSDLASSILIDSAPTSFASYLLLERVIEQFNAGQVPGEMLRGLPDERRHAITDAVRGDRKSVV